FHRALPGVLMTVGANTQGQLGDASLKNQWVPQLLNAKGPATTSVRPTRFRVDGCTEEDPSSCLLGRDIRAVAAGAAHVVAVVTGTAGAWSWGMGEAGQLGHPKPPVPASASKFFRPTFRVLRPRFIQALRDVHVTHVACGSAHTLFLTKELRVFGCGSNSHGQLLGEAPKDADEVAIVEEPKDLEWTPPSGSVRQIGAGEHHSIALTTDGAVFTWGRNDKGQLGHTSSGDAKSARVPTQVPGLPSIETIFTAYNATFAVEFAQAVALPKVDKAAATKKTKGNAVKAPPAKRSKK
ncbi:hypothetical protein DYB28_004361, partial [Aphanomyces astaci]